MILQKQRLEETKYKNYTAKSSFCQEHMRTMKKETLNMVRRAHYHVFAHCANAEKARALVAQMHCTDAEHM